MSNNTKFNKLSSCQNSQDTGEEETDLGSKALLVWKKKGILCKEGKKPTWGSEDVGKISET